MVEREAVTPDTLTKEVWPARECAWRARTRASAVVAWAVLIHLIADFGPQDLAFAEVTQRLLRLLPGATVVSTPVPAFATLAAGFVAAQLAAAEAPDGTLVFVNVAPRRDDASPRRDNDGERLLWAVLPSGVQVVGVDAGEAFSFLAEVASEIRPLRWPTAGSQFRSRDLFPEAIARVLAGEPEMLGPAIDPAELPAVPEGRVAYVDGFGNVKTTWRWGALPAGLKVGDVLRVEVGETGRPGRLVEGSFAVAEGELAVAPGSSGYLGAAGTEPTRWVELFLRGGNAAEALGGPRPGDPVRLSAP